MSQYSARDIEQFNKRDKRISWLSIFSSLCTLYSDNKNVAEWSGDLAKKAYELNDELNTKYPMDEPEPFTSGPKYHPVENKVCAECGSPLKFIEAGVSKKTGRAYNAFWSCPNRHPQN